jgi:2-oxoglutarate ferredoxin oxidoreductase subunit alpha
MRWTRRGFKLVERLQPNAQELQNYTRFRLTESGISPISHPGMKGGSYLAAGIEHNEAGAPTSSGEMHAKMNDKRLRKLSPLQAASRSLRPRGRSRRPPSA